MRLDDITKDPNADREEDQRLSPLACQHQDVNIEGKQEREMEQPVR